jgi:hypothetical protein
VSFAVSSLQADWLTAGQRFSAVFTRGMRPKGRLRLLEGSSECGAYAVLSFRILPKSTGGLLTEQWRKGGRFQGFTVAFKYPNMVVWVTGMSYLALRFLRPCCFS